MSDRQQTGAAKVAYGPSGFGERELDLLLYALNEAGEPAFAERLPPEERQLVRERALGHLERYHAVEVWEGPTCILRLRRAGGK